MTRRNQKPLLRAQNLSTDSGLDQLHDEINGMILQPVDESHYVSRPPEAGATYGEESFDYREKEQPELHSAEADELCLPHEEAAAAAKVDADNEQILIDAHEPVTKQMWEWFAVLSVLLVGTVPRTAKEKPLYYTRMGSLLVGDVVAVSGGLITLGEIPALAMVQAMAAGVAAIISGLIAAEIKKARQARERQIDYKSMSDEQKKQPQLYRGPDKGEFIVKIVVGGSLLVVLLIGLGIFMLRSTTQGSSAGMVFACLAIAVALASWVNTYSFTDTWRDILDVAYEQAKRNTADHQKLTAAPARAVLASHTAAIASIRAEYAHRGNAAALRIAAEKHAWLTKFPGVVGHGPKASQKFIPPLPATEQLADQDLLPSPNGKGNHGGTS